MNVAAELDLTKMRKLAEALAGEASDWLGRSGEVRGVAFKADCSIVTEADLAVQALMADRLESECPDHAIIGEESTQDHWPGATLETARYCWVIDPIDGTRNYAVGFPCFATSIALLDYGVPVVGVVREHNTGRTYSAAVGCGATCDNRPIEALKQRVSGDRIVAFASSKDELSVGICHRWISQPGLVARNLGSAAMHLALVASGAIEGAFARRCKIWDIAAGALLVTEAGGKATRLDGKPLFPFDFGNDPNVNTPILAGTCELHRELLSDIQQNG